MSSPPAEGMSSDAAVADVAVIEDPAVAATLLDPVRARVLAALAEPGSATTVAASLGLTRQQVNYHVRTLETHGLVTFVEARPRRGVHERIVRASAKGYVVSPAVLGGLAADPARADQLSARYLIALSAQVVRDVSGLMRSAARARKSLPTLAIDTDVRFASAADRASFTAELAQTVRSLAATYHDEHTAGGRWHRVVVAAYPRPATEEAKP